MTTIEHDPESGCSDCPLNDHDFCEADRDEAGLRRWRPVTTLGRAAHWCPLRSGPVTVRAPGKSAREAAAAYDALRNRHVEASAEAHRIARDLRKARAKP